MQAHLPSCCFRCPASGVATGIPMALDRLIAEGLQAHWVLTIGLRTKNRILRCCPAPKWKLNGRQMKGKSLRIQKGENYITIQQPLLSLDVGVAAVIRGRCVYHDTCQAAAHGARMRARPTCPEAAAMKQLPPIICLKVATVAFEQPRGCE